MSATTEGDDIPIYTLAEARVFRPQGIANMAILAIRSGTETTHYALSFEDLGGLAERLKQDAILLKAAATLFPGNDWA